MKRRWLRKLSKVASLNAALSGTRSHKPRWLAKSSCTVSFTHTTQSTSIRNGAALEIPAPLSAEVSERVRALSIAAFKVLNCVGMARVDLFLADHGRLLVNEITPFRASRISACFPCYRRRAA
jgi:D-Ala-D-Ala ligase-like protein